MKWGGVDEAPDRGDCFVRQQAIDEGTYAFKRLGRNRLGGRYPFYCLEPRDLFNEHMQWRAGSKQWLQ